MFGIIHVNIMDNLIDNPNLGIHIGQKILDFLDSDSLKSCRLVNSSMKNMVDEPKYWIQKLDKQGLSQEHSTKWRKLIDLVENTDLEGNVIKCLIRMHHNFKEWAQAPIHIACKAGDASLVQMILNHVDESMGPNEFGATPICLAASRGHLEVLKVLISIMDNPNEAVNSEGWTPIHHAARYGKVEAVKLLMTTTKSPNAPNKDGTTPIHLAARHGHLEVLKLLITSTTSDENPNNPDQAGNTPIFWAVCEEHIELVKILVSVTDNPNLPRNDGWSPLHIAAAKGNMDIVKLLISATEFTNAPDNTGNTPRDVALRWKHYDIANFLLHAKK